MLNITFEIFVYAIHKIKVALSLVLVAHSVHEYQINTHREFPNFHQFFAIVCILINKHLSFLQCLNVFVWSALCFALIYFGSKHRFRTIDFKINNNINRLPLKRRVKKLHEQRARVLVLYQTAITSCDEIKCVQMKSK